MRYLKQMNEGIENTHKRLKKADGKSVKRLNERTIADVFKQGIDSSDANELENGLNSALRAKRNILINTDNRNTIAIIKKWAKLSGVNLVIRHPYLMDDDDIDGAVIKGEDGKIKHLRNAEFDDLDAKNSVLVLDDYNNAPQSVRNSLANLIRNHSIKDGSSPKNVKYFPNFLFTIAITSPRFGNLDSAEKNMFSVLNISKDNFDESLKKKSGKRLNEYLDREVIHKVLTDEFGNEYKCMFSQRDYDDERYYFFIPLSDAGKKQAEKWAKNDEVELETQPVGQGFWVYQYSELPFTLKESLKKNGIKESIDKYSSVNEIVDFIVKNFKRVMGVSIDKVFNQPYGDTDGGMLFNQDVIDSTYERLQAFLEKKGLADKIEDVAYALDDKLTSLAHKYTKQFSESLKKKSNKRINESKYYPVDKIAEASKALLGLTYGNRETQLFNSKELAAIREVTRILSDKMDDATRNDDTDLGGALIPESLKKKSNSGTRRYK